MASGFGGTCWNCGITGHQAKRCPNKARLEFSRWRGANPASIKCFNCEKYGHYKRDCPTLIKGIKPRGGAEYWKQKEKPKEIKNQSLATDTTKSVTPESSVKEKCLEHTDHEMINGFLPRMSSPNNDVPSLSTSNDVPSLSTPNDVPSLSTSNDVPSLSTPNDVPNMSPSNDVPNMSPSNDVPNMSPPNDVPNMSPSNDVPNMSPPNDVPNMSPSNDDVHSRSTEELSPEKSFSSVVLSASIIKNDSQEDKISSDNTSTHNLPNFTDAYFDEEPNEKQKKPVWQHHSDRGTGKKKHKDLILYKRVATYPSYLDTHCHLEYLLEKHRLRTFSDLVSWFCYPCNFDGCITSFCDPAAFSSFSCYEELLSEDKVWASFGLHPHHAQHCTPILVEKLIDRLTHSKCVALGEIGLDYSEHSLKQSSKVAQKELLYRLLPYCQAFNKPVVLHCRDAEDDLFEIISTALPRDWFIHLHCYTGTLEMANQFLSTFPNLYLGLTGHLTYFKFKESHKLAQTVSLNRLLLETDAPYMLPAAFKSTTMRWSHPPMAVCVAEEIAKIRHCSVNEIITITRENARIFYGI